MKTQWKIARVTTAAAFCAAVAGSTGCGNSNQKRAFSTVPPATAESVAIVPGEATANRPAMRLARPASAPIAMTAGYPDASGMEAAAGGNPAAMRPETAGWAIGSAVAHSPAPANNPGNPVSVFGEIPGQRSALNADATLLDGMESLSQVTFAMEGAAFDPCLSRDGKFIVFASTQHRATADIYIKPATGRTVTQLTADPAQDLMPAISPDGQRIAFASNRAGSWDVFIISASGGQAVQLTGDRTHELHPSWSPDGSKIVFCRLGEVSGRWELWVMDVNRPVVSEFIGYGLFPHWCPVSGTGEGGKDKIVFQRSRERGDRAFSVWTVDYKDGDASSPTEIASSPTAALINPAWSPDGKRIVFAATPNPGTVGGSMSKPSLADLWMTDMNGTGRVNLTAGRFVNLMPTWAPDGRIYFVSDRGGIENVWSIGTEKAIVAATGHSTAPRTTETAQAGQPQDGHGH